MQYKLSLKSQLRQALAAVFNEDQLDLLAADTSEPLGQAWLGLPRAKPTENRLLTWINYAEAEECLLLVVETALTKSKSSKLQDVGKKV
jgi:hypothetical protein